MCLDAPGQAPISFRLAEGMALGRGGSRQRAEHKSCRVPLVPYEHYLPMREDASRCGGRLLVGFAEDPRCWRGSRSTPARYFDLNFTAEAIARRMLRHMARVVSAPRETSETASRRSAAASTCARAPSSAWWQGARRAGSGPDRRWPTVALNSSSFQSRPSSSSSEFERPHVYLGVTWSAKEVKRRCIRAPAGVDDRRARPDARLGEAEQGLVRQKAIP